MVDVCEQFAEREDEGGVRRWHNRLLDSYIRIEKGEEEHGEGREREWWNEVKAGGKYIVGNVCRHLIGGGLWKEAVLVVSDVRWTMRRREDGDGWD